MPLAKSHSSASRINRRAKSNYCAPLKAESERAPKKYARVESIIDDVYADIANSMSKSEILKKLKLGMYADQEGKEMKRRNAYDYYNAALDRFAVDTDIEAEKLRNVFYGRYEALLEEAIKRNDLYNARGILDSMSRIFGVERKTPATAIQINGGDEKIVVNFGLSDEGG